MTREAPASQLPIEARPAVVKVVREVDSSELLRGETEVLIRHVEELYRLKLTRNGKLILQK